MMMAIMVVMTTMITIVYNMMMITFYCDNHCIDCNGDCGDEDEDDGDGHIYIRERKAE